ncbi:TIM-barrel domain-containing protein [Niveibacterium umoris]|uniref:Alpha-glucosidase n=1 Tax=Niveibacterium umoris TaxID=1193620 RepID=A0A840BIC6_9RHOO|nr:TIM-barrel domain-containing protein [Niveibacterium umoris]MBB4012975.1 alpha-glucosidase [Niveibacterium umoris]
MHGKTIQARRWAALTSACCVLLAGCGGGGASAAAPTPPAPAEASYFPSATPQLRLSQNGRQVMLTLLRDDMLHVAYSAQIEPGTPFMSPMVAPRSFSGPASYTWDPDAKRLTTTELVVELDQGCWRVSARQPETRVLTRLCVGDWQASGLTLTMSGEGATDVLGLGEQLANGGRKAPSWLGSTRVPASQYGNAMTYSDISASGDMQVPVAYVLGEGQRNWGFFVDSAYPLRFDFRAATWTLQSPSPSLGMFVFTGADLPDLRRDYLSLTGTPPVPPLKAFGLWISEYGYDNWAELDDKLTTLRGKGYPVDGAVLDLQWFGGINSGSQTTSMGKLSWDTAKFPNPAGKLAGYAASGVGTILIEESYIGGALPEFRKLADQRYLAMDCAPPCTDATVYSSNPWWGIGGMIDWSNPGAGTWWHDAKRVALINDGVMGHWTDLGEPEMFSAASQYFGIDWYGAHPTRHADVHNLLNFFWSRSIASDTARTHPQRRPWILSRSGAAGSQRFGVAMWSGDVQSSFAALGAQMTAQTNMSLSGFDYYGSDVGGFDRAGMSGAPLSKLYTRWFATSALLDVPLRPHVENLCNCTETAPDRIGDAASNLAALQLRYRLVPYLYGLAHAAHDNGDAVFPPLAYHFQQDKQARSVVTTKMVGPWLLFGAPSGPDATMGVYLPTGTWTDFNAPDRRVDSKGAFSQENLLVANLLRAPIFLREGAIVPMLREAPAHLGDPRGRDIHWFNDLLIRVVPAAAESRFVLVEDDGITRAYEGGRSARTTLVASRSDTAVRFTLTPDNRSGATATRRMTLEFLLANAAVREVRVGGQVLAAKVAGTAGPGWYASAGGVTLELGDRSVDAALDVGLMF